MAKDELPIVQTHCAFSLDDLSRSRDTSCNLVFHSGLFVEGTPRSGRIDPSTKRTEDEEGDRKRWTKRILDAIGKPKFPPSTDECYLYVTFYLYQDRYDIDLDNLLKLFMDGLVKRRLVENDKLFCCIRAKKEPVANKSDQGAKFRCITAKTMTIQKVRDVPGNQLVKSWKSPMQLITAVDRNDNKNLFIDHPSGVFLRDEHENRKYYRDLISGYNWKKRIGKPVTGCLVQERRHHNRNAQGVKVGSRIHLHWLHKWPD